MNIKDYFSKEKYDKSFHSNEIAHIPSIAADTCFILDTVDSSKKKSYINFLNYHRITLHGTVLNELSKKMGHYSEKKQKILYNIINKNNFRLKKIILNKNQSKKIPKAHIKEIKSHIEDRSKKFYDKKIKTYRRTVNKERGVIDTNDALLLLSCLYEQLETGIKTIIATRDINLGRIAKSIDMKPVYDPNERFEECSGAWY